MKRQMCFYSLRRSGHHAVMNWIMKNLPGKIFFLNNTMSKTVVMPTEPELDAIWSEYDVFALNMEDWGFDNPVPPTKYIPRLVTENYYVLRNPFNFMASRLANRWVTGDLKKPEWCRTLLDQWKAYAIRYLDGNRDTIVYDKWFLSEDYRREIAAFVGFEYSEQGLLEVPAYGVSTGTGSTFDNLNYDGRANEMKVLERYQKFEHNKQYLNLFDDEVVSLAIQIFGKRYIPNRFQVKLA